MLVSGGFDPVHKGHLEMIAHAREQADEVWVILNNDRWLREKKGQEFMKQNMLNIMFENSFMRLRLHRPV